MRSKEIILLAGSGIHVAHHNEKARVLQMKVGIDISNGIITYFYSAICSVGSRICLHGILTEAGIIIRSKIFRKISHVSTEIATQHTGNLEFDV